MTFADEFDISEKKKYGIKHENEGEIAEPKPNVCAQRVPMNAIEPEYKRYDSISYMHCVFCVQTAATSLDYKL